LGSYERFKLEKELEDLINKISSDGSTCMVSLYVPPERAISDFVQEITNEIGTAANIRSKTTKKNVVAALQVVTGKLRLYGNKAPKSGIALFAGVTSDSGTKVESRVIEPHLPISRKLYVCDNRFHVEHILDSMSEKDMYALVAIDNAKATIASLQGDKLDIIKTTRSGAAKKHRKGGQSSVRFARLREEAIHKFMLRISEDLKDIFIEDPEFELKGVILGGPGVAKDQLVPNLDHRLRDKVVAIKDIGYGGDISGINELVALSQDVLEGVALLEEKKLVQEFLNNLLTGKANYGQDAVTKNLENGQVETLLISEAVDMKIVEALGALAEETGARIEIIGTSTDEGRQIDNFGGICAILRYQVTM